MVGKTLIFYVDDLQFKLMLSHDGSGKGAALVAAVASRILKEREENSEKTRDHAKSNPH